MERLRKLLSIVTVTLSLAAFFLLPDLALACPTCGVEGLSDNQARGFYLSYLLLLVAPFALVALVGSQVLRAYNSRAFEKVMRLLRPSRQAVWIYLPVGLAVGAVAFYAAASQSRTQSFPLPRQLLIGKADVGGRGPILRETLEGKVVLVNFFATWCPLCQEEIPDLVELHKALSDLGLEVIGVTFDLEHEGEPGGGSAYSPKDASDHKVSPHPRAVLLSFLRSRGVGYPVISSTPEIESSFGGIEGMPITFLFRRDGQLAKKYWGPPSPDVLRSDIRRLL
jgi:thiol-disulfide isomerase/thioredoxin